MGFTKDKDEGIGLVYLNQIKNIPLLSFEDELELSKLIQQGDKKARSRLIEANLRLVVKIARSYSVKDVLLMDLVQEGNMGLLRAADKFDFKRNLRFSTYATWWIRQSIMRYLLDKRRAIHLPRRKEEILRKIERSFHSLSQQYMRRPKNEEIASEIGVPVEEVESVLSITSELLPLETERRSDDGCALVNTHGDYTYCPERALLNQSLRDAAQHILKRLKARERRILIYHYQLNGAERHTLKKLGDLMGISPETVRQIKIKALEKIRADAGELKIYT